MSGPVDPITPPESDIVAGSVFTGEREGMNRWTPKWGGRPSALDWAALAGILIFAAAVVAVWLI